MKILATIVFIVLVGLSSNSRAKNPDGEALLRNCSAAALSDPNSEQMALGFHCLGLVQGVINTHQFYQAKFKNRAPWVCIPETGITNGQGAEIVRKYLVNHPEQRSKDSSLLVTLALLNTFPCPRHEP
jgi:hypothetical protein